MSAAEYRIRVACGEDSGIIAGHRAAMFRDMGLLSPEEHESLWTASKPWIARTLADGRYKGWLIEHENSVVVAGGGVLLRESGPVPGCLRVGRWAHIVNVYTV